ncbi:MAG: ABC transporter ATP-binding protein [Dietzia sp.]
MNNHTSAAPRLRVRDLTVTADSGAEVVQNVSFDLMAGEILGIVGESGSGKTTLGLALLAYARRGLRIAAGAIEVDGKDLLRFSQEQLRAARGALVSYVPQDPGTALNPVRRVGPQLRECLTAHGVDGRSVDRRMSELVTEVGLDTVPKLLSAYPHQLSGGQQQRVTIAMAFACRPGLIVLDEPTTGLDAATQQVVLNTVRSLCERYGTAAVYVSHDIDVVRRISDRVAVVYSGRVVEIASSTELFDRPAHPYTRGLLMAVPSTDSSRRLVGIDGFPPRPGQRPPGCAFSPRCPVVIDRCATQQPSLVPVGSAGHSARCHLATEAPTSLPLPQVRAGADSFGDDVRNALVRVEDLSAGYGHKTVLAGVSLAVAPGECLAVVGESGSGKTTFARCLSGLHTQWTGAITYRDQPVPPGVRARSPEMLRDIQYIFQNPYAALNPRRTIGALVSQPLDQFGRFSRQEKADKARAALEAVSLTPELLNRYPDQLSGGERQRVAIARALIVEPQVLVCDEITSALDVSVQAALVETLLQLRAERGVSLIFITHNLALVRSIAQRLVVLDGGVIVEAGETATVLDRPQATYTRSLLAAGRG